MLSNLRRVRRSLRVAATGARIYIGYKRTQRRVRTWPAERSATEWERSHERFAAELYRLAIDLRGLYIKTGQFLGARSDVVPEAYVRSLSRLQDRVPPREASVIRAIVERELGRPIASLFASFDDRPLAAASLAQVHRATLPDGREVAVKVQYPEVAALVALDVRNLRTLVGLVARREPRFDYRAIVAELASQVPLELDFVREAEMTRRVAQNLAGLPRIAVPPVIDGMVTRRVLVTGYLDGTRLLESGAYTGSDGPGIARAIADAYGHQIMVDGLFQADPHPGNILLLPGGRVGLIDFGLTKELPGEVRLAFARLVLATADRDLSRIVDALRGLGVRSKSDRPEDVLALMSLFFEPRDPALRGAAYRLRASETLSRSPVEAIPGDLVLLGRVVGLLRGVSASLGETLSPMQMLRPFAERALAAASDAEEGAAAG